MTLPPTQRRAELAANLAAVRSRIDRARVVAGRADPVTLIAVTKYFPAGDVDLLCELGVRDVGENKVQEATAKVAGLAHRGDIRVHFIGQLQSNKVRAVTAWADVVQSVDREKLVTGLGRGALEHGRRIDVLVQVSLDDPHVPGRGGAAPDGARRLADLVAGTESLTLRGVMAVAPVGADPRAAFARLAEVARGIREDHPQATWISAGMSADLEEAVEEGATHLRVGTAILGSRPSLG